MSADWERWQSRYGKRWSGVFYATPSRCGPGEHPVTLAAPSPGLLDELIRAQEDFWAGLEPSPPECHLSEFLAS